MQADATTLAGTGALVAGVKYMFVRGSGDEVYVKKGNTGVVFCKCNTCILVGYHDDYDYDYDYHNLVIVCSSHPQYLHRQYPLPRSY